MSKLTTGFGALAFTVLLGAAVEVSQADVLDMRGTENAGRFDAPGKPGRGMTQARVEQNYGQPSRRVGAVGDPPISSWEYPDFVVFFEYDKVIHAVSKRRP